MISFWSYFYCYFLSVTITAFFTDWTGEPLWTQNITPRSTLFVIKHLTEPITSPHCFFFSLKASASVQLANEPRKKMLLTVFLLLDQVTVSACCNKVADQTVCAGGDSSAWKIIFNIPTDHFYLYLDSHLCKLMYFNTDSQHLLTCQEC